MDTRFEFARNLSNQQIHPTNSKTRDAFRSNSHSICIQFTFVLNLCYDALCMCRECIRIQHAISEHHAMKTITLRIDSKDHAMLLTLAKRERMSMTAFLLRLLDKHLETIPPVITKAAPKTAMVDGELLEFDE
jgi:hypothetical protein